MHKPISIKDISLYFANQSCFHNFSYNILNKERIAIIGSNGSGKSSLLKIIAGIIEPTEGKIVLPDNITMQYVPQLIESSDNLSGGEQQLKYILPFLLNGLDLLLLDEPSNHLDNTNQKILLENLNDYNGTLLIVTHDENLLNNLEIDTIWHIYPNEIRISKTSYSNYLIEYDRQKQKLLQQIDLLNKKEKTIHQKKMQQQQRQAKSKHKGEKSKQQNKWSKIAANQTVNYAEQSSGKINKDFTYQKELIKAELSNLFLPEQIKLKFDFLDLKAKKSNIINVNNATIGYLQHNPLLENLSFFVDYNTRLAIKGRNGSGKSSLVKSILGDPKIIRTGEWILPPRSKIGYLDQKYANLIENKTVFENISLVTDIQYQEIRKYLNEFLFRNNQEVDRKVKLLSGGERVRLSLAKLIISKPILLILDEITNNLDLDTKNHVIQILKSYPNALIVISHDENFLQQIGIDQEIRLD